MQKAVPVVSEHRLFVDDAILDETRGVKRKLHQLAKRPENPIMFNDRPWESHYLRMHGSVLRDPVSGELRMWYTGSGGSPDEVRFRSVVSCAASLDGIHWKKPALHLYDYHGQTANNICCRPHFDETGEKWYIGAVGVIHDLDDPDPLRRYKMMTTQKKTDDEFNTDTALPSGVYVAFSPDGLHWREHPQPYFTMIDGFSDTLGVMHDRRNQRYVAHVKFATPEYGKGRFKRFNWVPGEGYFGWDEARRKWVTCPSTRLRGVTVSEDFIHWSEPKFILPIDETMPNSQVYDTSIFQYESLYLGLADIYHPDETGTIDCQLIWSRDGLDWHWAFDRTPVLPVGRDLSDWDCGCLCTANSPPVRMGDELWFYYGAVWWRHPGGNIKKFCTGVHGSAIGVATLRVDGFVSVDAGARRGKLTTVPVRLSHDALCVNADAEGGEVRAQLLRRGRPIPGFDFRSCTPLQRDAVRHVLRFKGGPIPKSRAPLRIEFALKNASLYSLWTEPPPPLPA